MYQKEFLKITKEERRFTAFRHKKDLKLFIIKMENRHFLVDSTKVKDLKIVENKANGSYEIYLPFVEIFYENIKRTEFFIKDLNFNMENLEESILNFLNNDFLSFKEIELFFYKEIKDQIIDINEYNKFFNVKFNMTFIISFLIVNKIYLFAFQEKIGLKEFITAYLLGYIVMFFKKKFIYQFNSNKFYLNYNEDIL